MNKTNPTLWLILLSIVSIVYAQENDYSNSLDGMYFTFKGGFTFPVSNSTIGSPRAEVGNDLLFIKKDGTEFDYSEKNPFGSRGAGGTIAAGVGYMFNENFGIELEMSVIRTLEIIDARKDIDTSAAGRYFAEQRSYTNMFRAAPMFVVMGNEDMKVRPYAKFGLLVPLAGATVASLEFDDETGELSQLLFPVLDKELYDEINAAADSVLGFTPTIPTTSQIKAKTFGQFSLGFTAKFGTEFKLSDKWNLFTEMELNMLTVKAKQTKITEFYAAVSDEGLVATAEFLLGREIDSEFTTSEIPEILRITNYQNEITEESNSTYDANAAVFDRNAPYEQLTFRDNYNSFGFMMGIRYTF